MAAHTNHRGHQCRKLADSTRELTLNRNTDTFPPSSLSLRRGSFLVLITAQNLSNVTDEACLHLARKMNEWNMLILLWKMNNSQQGRSWNNCTFLPSGDRCSFVFLCLKRRIQTIYEMPEIKSKWIISELHSSIRFAGCLPSSIVERDENRW